MGDHSSENYLDQLLNSMHGEETEHPKEQQAAKQVLRDDFEKQLFGEEETKEKAKAKNEEDFLREFEEELLKEDIPEYTESLNQKKQEEKATQIDASLDDLLDNIPQDDFSTGDAAKEEETGFQGKSPLETAIPPDEDDFEVNTLDDAVGTFDSNLPKEEDGELDLSGLSVRILWICFPEIRIYRIWGICFLLIKMENLWKKLIPSVILQDRK